MKFYPERGELKGSDDRVIKKLSCPLNLAGSDLAVSSIFGYKYCHFCSAEVIDTRFIDEGEIKALVARDGTACLVVWPDQDNIEVVNEFGDHH